MLHNLKTYKNVCWMLRSNFLLKTVLKTYFVCKTTGDNFTQSLQIDLKYLSDMPMFVISVFAIKYRVLIV